MLLLNIRFIHFPTSIITERYTEDKNKMANSSTWNLINVDERRKEDKDMKEEN